MAYHNTRHYQEKTLEEKFWVYVTPGPFTECWIWQGPTDHTKGYGRLYYSRHSHIKAHRLSYQIHHGPIPEGMLVCHTCDNPICVNPYHLFAGTNADNMADMASKQRYTIPDNRGQDNGQAKLTEVDVVAIRAMYQSGIARKVIARQFGINPTHVSRIVLRQRWDHIP